MLVARRRRVDRDVEAGPLIAPLVQVEEDVVVRLFELACGALALVDDLFHRLERRVEVLHDRHRVAEEVVWRKLHGGVVAEDVRARLRHDLEACRELVSGLGGGAHDNVHTFFELGIKLADAVISFRNLHLASGLVERIGLQVGMRSLPRRLNLCVGNKT